jgi:hypothetical protein
MATEVLENVATDVSDVDFDTFTAEIGLDMHEDVNPDVFSALAELAGLDANQLANILDPQAEPLPELPSEDQAALTEHSVPADALLKVGFDFSLLNPPVETTDGIRDYYTQFAFQNGFTCRTERTEYRVVNGVRDKDTPINFRVVCSSPTKCKAGMRVIRSVSTPWVVKAFNNEHNHPLLSHEEVEIQPCHRRLTKDMQEKALALQRAGVDVNKICRILRAEYGRKILLPEDVQSLIQRRRNANVQKDALRFIDYLGRRKMETPGFYSEWQRTTDNRLGRAFWIEEDAVRRYQAFGDVIVFDTTFQTNMYRFPFAPFIGVDNNGLTQLLGCGLILDETECSFTWLFEAFLRAVGTPPQTIFTDQDQAMANALAKVMPDTNHALCIWHIARKFPIKFSAKLTANDHDGTRPYKDFIHEFYRVMRNVSIDEVEGSLWPALLNKYELDDDEHLESLYAIREKWMPCYIRRFFCAGMSTTQRSEGFNSMMDGFINTRTTLLDFAMRMNELDERRRVESVKRAYINKKRLKDGKFMYRIQLTPG